MSKHVAVGAGTRTIHKLTLELEVEELAKIHKTSSMHIHQDSFQPFDSQDPLTAYAKKAEVEVVKNLISAWSQSPKPSYSSLHPCSRQSS